MIYDKTTIVSISCPANLFIHNITNSGIILKLIDTLQVGVSVFTNYLSSMGWLPAALMVIFFMVDQGAAMGSNIWLSNWSDDVNAFNVTSARHMYLGGYAAFGIAQGRCCYYMLILILIHKRPKLYMHM